MVSSDSLRPSTTQSTLNASYEPVCEICHAPLGAHILADGSVVKPPIDRSFTLCARCHRKMAARPAKFPQVDLDQHVSGPVEGKVCLECHDPHSPKT